MSKEEFLNILRIKISNVMPSSEVESQIDYYRAYIEGEIMKGKTQEQVLEELGDPALIAKTLTSSIRRATEEVEYEEGSNNQESYAYNEQSNQPKTKVYSGAGCIVALIIAFIIFIGLIILIFKLGFAILRILWPVILVLVIGGIIFSLIRRR